MSNARKNWYIWTGIALVMLTILTVIGFSLEKQKIMANAIFGITGIISLPIIVLFFMSKSEGSRYKKKRDKFNIEYVSYYLGSVDADDLKKNKNTYVKKTKFFRFFYIYSFSLFNASIFILCACLLTFL